MTPGRVLDAAEPAALKPAFARLADADLAEHLLTRRSVALPDAPPPTAAALQDADRVRQGRFLLVGEEYALPDGFSWRPNPSADKEWQIAQHKQYFSPALLQAHLQTGDEDYLHTWERLLRSWLDEMGTGFITASDAQVEALRLRNWLDAYLLLRRLPAWRPDGALLRRWVERMGAEAEYVASHLKPVRNHRTFQLASVFAVGVCFPELSGSDELAELARRELTANLLTDLLPDGVQVEMSTHYHQLVVETAVAFVDLATRNAIPLEPALLDRVHAALRWSLWLTWPDGHIPLLGDSDDGDHAELLRTGARLYDDPELLWGGTRGREGTPPRALSADFAASGYVAMTDTWGSGPRGYAGRTHVLYDAARLGEGAHSHYDLFSLTLHTDGRPALVDPGRYTYSATPDADGRDWRHAFKTTTAHNTVAVDGRDQTRYVPRNKHGPDVQVEDRRVLLGDRGDWVVAAARSAEYTPVHTRLLVFVLRQYVLVVDRVAVDDGDSHTADLGWHLPDGVTPALDVTGESARLRDAPLQLLTWVAPGARPRLAEGWVSRQYGVKHRAPVVRVEQDGATDLFFVTAAGGWGPPGRRLELADLRALPPTREGLPGFAVTGSLAGERFTDTVWLSRGGVRIPGLTGDGRFAIVRTDAAGRPLWVTGEDVLRVDLPGVPPRSGPGADLEWAADPV